jgi:hypothetical protein
VDHFRVGYIPKELDKAPELSLNQIIWKSIKGADSEMPMPHTRRDSVQEEEDD